MGNRMRQLEAAAGRTLDDAAHQLLRVGVVRKPARWLANSRYAWAMASRMDRIRTRRRETRVQQAPVPHHVGIIMDGNRRFAKALGLKITSLGHVAGQLRLEQVLDWCLDLDIKTLTVYAFSTENFERAGEERELLMELFQDNFERMAVDPRVHDNKIRVHIIGHLELLPDSVQESARKVMDATRDYDGYTFNIAVAYGGRQEIVDAVKDIAEEAKAGTLDPQSITPACISKRLYTKDSPDPDFIIRTSGEERISNFLLWQLAYAELYFAEVNWPQFTKAKFLEAIEEFQRRQRRFGR